MKYILSIIFSAFNFLCFSQNYQVQFPVNNYIFTHIYNPIDIKYCGDLNDLELSSNSATITKHSLGKYNIQTEKEGYIQVYVYNKKSKLSDTLKIRVEKLPMPIIQLSAYSEGRDIRQILLTSSGLRTENDGLPCWNVDDSNLTFDLTITKGKEIYKFKNQKNPFTQNIRTLFTEIGKDDLIIFYNVKFNSEYILNDLVYEIK